MTVKYLLCMAIAISVFESGRPLAYSQNQTNAGVPADQKEKEETTDFHCYYTVCCDNGMITECFDIWGDPDPSQQVATQNAEAAAEEFKATSGNCPVVVSCNFGDCEPLAESAAQAIRTKTELGWVLCRNTCVTGNGRTLTVGTVRQDEEKAKSRAKQMLLDAASTRGGVVPGTWRTQIDRQPYIHICIVRVECKKADETHRRYEVMGQAHSKTDAKNAADAAAAEIVADCEAHGETANVLDEICYRHERVENYKHTTAARELRFHRCLTNKGWTVIVGHYGINPSSAESAAEAVAKVLAEVLYDGPTECKDIQPHQSPNKRQ